MDERLLNLRKEAKANGEPVLREKSFELLLEMIKKYKPKNILEIGTNVGLSGIAMLLTCETSNLTTIEIDEKKVEQAKINYKFFGVDNRAKVFIGDASQIIPVLCGNYDFIFLDGPKGHYFEYLDNLLDVLNVGGILFADNVLYHGYVFNKVPHKHATIAHSMERFLTAIKNNKSLKTTVYEIEDGVSVTEKII